MCRFSVDCLLSMDLSGLHYIRMCIGIQVAVQILYLQGELILRKNLNKWWMPPVISEVCPIREV